MKSTNEDDVVRNAVGARDVADGVATWLMTASLDARVLLCRILLPALLAEEQERQKREFREAGK